MPIEVETVLHLDTRRRHVSGAVSVRHMIEQEVWLEPSMASLKKVEGFSPNINVNGWVTIFKELKY